MYYICQQVIYHVYVKKKQADIDQPVDLYAPLSVKANFKCQM